MKAIATAVMLFSIVGLALGGVKGKEPKRIVWLESCEQALKQAKRSKKPVLVLFGDRQCGGCQELASRTLNDPQVLALASKFVWVRLDIKKETELVKRYFPKEERLTLPVLISMDASGKEFDRLVGHVPPEFFVQHLRRVLRGESFAALEAKLAKNPNDLPLNYRVAITYLERDRLEKAKPVIERIFKLDPQDKNKFHAPLHLHVGLRYALDGKKKPAIEHFQTILSKYPASDVAEEAKFYLGTLYFASGKLDEAKKLFDELARHSKSTLLKKKAQEMSALIEAEKK